MLCLLPSACSEDDGNYSYLSDEEAGIITIDTVGVNISKWGNTNDNWNDLLLELFFVNHDIDITNRRTRDEWNQITNR